MKNVARGGAVIGPIRQQQLRAPSISRNVSNQISPILSAQSVTPPGPQGEAQNPAPQTQAGMDEERRRIERLRREAIRKAMNR